MYKVVYDPEKKMNKIVLCSKQDEEDTKAIESIMNHLRKNYLTLLSDNEVKKSRLVPVSPYEIEELEYRMQRCGRKFDYEKYVC